MTNSNAIRLCLGLVVVTASIGLAASKSTSEIVETIVLESLVFAPYSFVIATIVFCPLAGMVLERKRVDRLDKAKTHVPGGGPAIVEARKKAGVSTAELSRLCTNISESMLSRYERGENEVKLCVLEEVARALKMKPIDLLKIAHSIYVDSLEKTYTSPYAREIIAQFRPRD